MTNSYLDSIEKQFRYYKMLGEKAMAQLSDENLFWQYNAESNSIAIIVKHLWGNMLSRWTGFLTSDGEKDWRNRETEFDNDLPNREALMHKWEEGWQCLFAAIDQLTEADLERQIFIRNMGHTVTGAINRQLAHYAYHIGQVVFIARMLCGSQWQSLSIPRGNSGEYNAARFSIQKHTEHFADEWLSDKEKLT